MKAFTYSLVVATCAVMTISAADAAARASHPRTGTSAGLQDDEGKKLYLKNCRQCHGANGEPNAESKAKYKKIKTLNDPKFMSTIPDDSILAVIKNGAGKDMKSFGDKLSHDEMVAVLKYVRSLAKAK